MVVDLTCDPSSAALPETGAPTPVWVAIGASAGGLDALQQLIIGLSPTGRQGYIVAQHMAGGVHAERLRQLLSHHSAMPVRVAADGDAPQVDEILLIPGGCHAVWQAGALHLLPPSEHYFSTPSVDALFASLAALPRGQACGIVLSGSGSDGAEGCKTLRQAGHTVLVQQPAEARFQGMPEAAMAARGAQVLSLADMTRWLQGPRLTDRPALNNPAPSASPEEEALARLLPAIAQLTQVDFGGYKLDTLLRRLAKRQRETAEPDLPRYVAWALGQPQELWLLQQRFLVSVSSFFRDRTAFEALAAAWSAQASTTPWRCWVPACATGEEAYTLAMLREAGVAAGRWSADFELLASDLNKEALAVARHACYAATALREMPVDYRNRWLLPATTQQEVWRVHEQLRSRVHFEQADLLHKVAPGPWDLISCRNLLIYLKAECQDRLIRAFHAQLKPDGLLFISPSETLGQAAMNLFVPVDMGHRIFRKVLR